MSKPIYIYVLRLTDGRYYVGQTLDLKRRLREHESGRGATFTQHHKPIEFLHCEEFNQGLSQAKFHENKLTLVYMQQYGWKNVRDGCYATLNEQTIWRLLRNTVYTRFHKKKQLSLPNSVMRSSRTKS
jgi:predicted GIY-YIG superfamily endonuclease